MMRSASREALALLRERQQSALGGQASSKALTSLAGELYAVADLLAGQPRLRRALGDPASSPDARAELIRGLISGKVGKAALQVVEAAVRERWSSPWDLTDALELSGDDALFAAAERDGVLEEVEDQLFRFGRILATESRLSTLLDDATVEPARRAALLDDVLGTKVHAITKAVLSHAVASKRRRSIAVTIDDLLDQAAYRRERSVARVVTAVPLTAEQQSRLVAALSELYGRAISLRTAVDAEVRGGLVVRIGDEVIDGSVAARLAEARGALAG